MNSFSPGFKVPFCILHFCPLHVFKYGIMGNLFKPTLQASSAHRNLFSYFIHSNPALNVLFNKKNWASFTASSAWFI